MENVKINDLMIDKDFEELLPPLTIEEFEFLESNILQVGCKDAITTWNGYIVDGHNRRNICLKHNLECKIYQLDTTVYKTKADVINWMIENQLGRRNLSLTEKYEIVQKYKTVIEANAKQNQSNAGKGLSTLSKVNTRKEMAKLVGTSEGTYTKLDKVFHSDNSTVKDDLKAGKISVNMAYEKIVPKSNINKGVDFSTVMDELNHTVSDVANTDECDALIEQLQNHMQRLNMIKVSIYGKRQKLYEDMPSDNMSCTYEEIDGQNILSHKYIFYLVKKNDNISNRKEAITISSYCMEDDQRYAEKISYIECQYSKEEAKLICMMASKVRECHMIKAEERKNQEKKLWDDYKKEFSKANKYFSDLQGWANIEPEMKLTMISIIKAGYKQLTKQCHPDVCGDNGEMMTNINIANEGLRKLIGC